MVAPTGFADAERVLQARLLANWTTTKIAWDNVDSKRLADGEDPWIRCAILEGETNQIGIGPSGAGYLRNVGVIILSVFVRENSGTRTAKAYADTLAAIWRGQEDTEIVFRAPSLVTVGAVGNAGWFQINLNVPFQWDSFV